MNIKHLARHDGCQALTEAGICEANTGGASAPGGRLVSHHDTEECENKMLCPRAAGSSRIAGCSGEIWLQAATTLCDAMTAEHSEGHQGGRLQMRYQSH
ncbi:hypothetical protein EYF80_053035 [Liparis tanakae]|uniref:Uncharacterized protein n=1 Tax=Liparis tanakae TaxID=230148 RepID=A0A4Z2F908_9TELE|nr:hypothetical protein EYF80_053035 [Liparis tanakae]